MMRNFHLAAGMQNAAKLTLRLLCSGLASGACVNFVHTDSLLRLTRLCGPDFFSVTMSFPQKGAVEFPYWLAASDARA